MDRQIRKRFWQFHLHFQAQIILLVTVVQKVMVQPCLGQRSRVVMDRQIRKSFWQFHLHFQTSIILLVSNSTMGCYDTTIFRAVTEGSYGQIDSQKILAIPSTFLDIDYSARNSCVEGYDTTISRAVTCGNCGYIDSQKFLTNPPTFLGIHYSARK